MKHILIIDDDESIRISLEMLLEDEGFKIYCSSTASEGLSISTKSDIDLVIVDLHIPDMEGDKLIIEINKIKPEMKFLIHTGDYNYSIPQTLTSLGLTNNNIILKPIFDLDVLTGKINKIINQ
ncbi:MAG: response regulator [Spirochaetaceae bacterium]